MKMLKNCTQLKKTFILQQQLQENQIRIETGTF